MAQFTIVERTEPVTLDEVFSFIDDTNISKMDAHELKSRIADMVKGIREKAIDEFISRLEKHTQENWIDHQEYGITWACIEQVAEEMRGAE